MRPSVPSSVAHLIIPLSPLEPFDIMSPSLSSAGVVSQAAPTISTPRRLLLLLLLLFL
jgi:hypothetical protein